MLPRFKKPLEKSEEGFTLIELMITVVIIGILAAIAIPVFANQQKSAMEAHAKSDIRQISQAITLAKIKTKTGLISITGFNFTAGSCTNIPGTELETLPKTHGCWTAYTSTLKKISDASGMNINGLVDPYGRPYYIDENEGEAGLCGKDAIGFYNKPNTATNANISFQTSYNVTIAHQTPLCAS